MVYLKKGCKVWYFTIRHKGRHIQGSTHKRDKAEALAVDHAMRVALVGKTPAAGIHALIDSIYGAGARRASPLAAVWDTYETYLVNSGKEMSKQTLAARRGIVGRFVGWCGENYMAAGSIAEVNRACAAAYARMLAERTPNAKTRKNIIQELSAVWSGIMRVNDEVESNPWLSQAPEVVVVRRRPAFTPEQEEAIMGVCREIGDGWELACLMARYTGLRWGDVAGMRWESIDMGERLIRLQPSKTKGKGIEVVIPIAPALFKEIERAHKAKGRDRRFVLPRQQSFSEMRASGRLKKERGTFASILERAGVRGDYTFHSWRHTFRTRLSEAGVSAEAAKRLGGWTVDATAEHYNHDTMIGELRKAINRI